MPIPLFNHVGRFYDPRICRLYSIGPRKREEYFFIIHTFKLTLRKLGGVIIMALYTLIIVHPNTIHMKHILLIPILLSEDIVHSNIITKNTNTIHKILTVHAGIIHYPY